MSGGGLSTLHRPDDAFNPALDRYFPSLRSCLRKDREEAVFLREEAALAGWPLREDLLDLAYCLDYERRGEDPPLTRASYVFQSRQRMHVGGAICELLDRAQNSGREVTFSTLIPRGGDFAPEALLEGCHPPRFIRQLNADLDRAHQRYNIEQTGFLILVFELEYQIAEGLSRSHWHGFASGGVIAALDSLRELDKYWSPTRKFEGPRDPVRRRIELTRRPLTNLRYLSAYPLKPESRARPVKSNQKDNRDRNYAEDLPRALKATDRLFYDRWRVEDITAVRGLRVINGRFQETRP